MKMFKGLSLIISSFVFLNGFCQMKPGNAEKLAAKYSDYFDLKSESLYLHLNKTTVLPTEDIWFTAYSFYNEFYKPSLTTRNLHVGVYNEKGGLVSYKTVFMEDGHGGGYFKLEPAKFPPGDYFIHASTSYMDNFSEDHSFRQPFTILGDKPVEPAERVYDLQVMPEGGYLLAGVENNVGVKLIDNSGKGVRFEGKVLDSVGEPVKLFRSNRFGMSNFYLDLKGSENYSITVTTEYGDELNLDLPKPELVGLALNVSSGSFGQFNFNIKTNNRTFEKLVANKFILAVHQEGKMKLIEFSIPEELEANVKLSNSVLFKGTNIVTIFNHKNEPLLERLVFNRRGIFQKSIKANFVRQDLDSLVLDILAPTGLGTHSLSISVLPKETKSYNPDHNILSAFYLKPFLRGHIENGGYYFSDKYMSTRDRDLDLLLLTQGWSKYSWSNIFNTPPKEVFPVEAGFTIKGKVNDKLKRKKNELVISSPDANLFETVSLDADGRFKLDNAFLVDSTTISFAIVQEKNNRVSQPSVTYQITPGKQPKHVQLLPIPGIQFSTRAMTKDLAPPEGFTRESELLDTVHLHTRIYNEEGKAMYLNESSTTTVTEISEREEEAFFYITDYIRNQGFRVIRRAGRIDIYSNRARLQMVDDLSGPTPIITVDGVRLYTYRDPSSKKQITDYDPILHMTTREVKSIKINKSGAGLGFGGTGGWIEIETRKNPRSYAASKSRGPQYLTSNGFELSKEFYTPKYSSFDNEYFKHYGAIAWFENLQLEEGKKTIKIFNTLQPELNLYIEGITQQGALISETITLKTK